MYELLNKISEQFCTNPDKLQCLNFVLRQVRNSQESAQGCTKRGGMG